MLKTPTYLHSSKAALLDFLYPPDRTDLTAARWLDEPCCNRCGFPFEVAILDLADCARCMARAPRFDRARSAFAYDAGSQDAVLGFKHGGRMANLDMFAQQLARAGRRLLEPGAVLMPVPLHPTRLARRRYNQAALLAGRLSRLTGLGVSDALHRTRRTESQGRKSAAHRRRNVRGAFRVRGAVPDHAVLIDDVMTTGATLEACALTLRRAGSTRVDALTLARVVREQSPETR